MPRRVLMFDEVERLIFEALIKSANMERQFCDPARLQELDNAIIFVQLIVKDGIPLEPWHP